MESKESGKQPQPLEQRSKNGGLLGGIRKFFRRARMALANNIRKRRGGEKMRPSAEGIIAPQTDNVGDRVNGGRRERKGRSSSADEQENIQLMRRRDKRNANKKLDNRRQKTANTPVPKKGPIKVARRSARRRVKVSTGSCVPAKERREDQIRPAEGGPSVSFWSPPTTLLSRFTFHSVLGQGGFGKVMSASFAGKDSTVAVKIIRKTAAITPSILKERRTLELARNSPFLCRGYAAFQIETCVFFVMDYMPGGSLEEHMRGVGCMTETSARFYSAEVVCGLQYLHSCGIVHRDIKPANILLDGEGHAKICDFGIVAENIFGAALTDEYCGSFPYMAPEMHLRKAYGAAVDWWAFGVTLFRMLNAGAFPFLRVKCKKASARSIINDGPKYNKELSEPAVSILNGLLRKEPQCRLGSAGDIRQHPFFEPINWEGVERRRLAPPDIQTVRSDLHLTSLRRIPSSPKNVKPTPLCNNHFLFGLSFASPDWTN